MANYYYELRMSIVAGGQFAQSVFHYVIDLPTPPDDWTAAKDLFLTLDDGGAASFLTRLRNCMSEDAYLSAVRVRQLAPTGGNTFSFVYETTDFPGTILQPCAAFQIAGCIIFVNSVDPDRTGRTFVPGVPKTFVTSSRWTATAVTNYELFGNRVLGGLVGTLGTFNAVTYDRVTKTGPIIDGCYLSPKLGTQRRRELPI